MGPGPHPTEGIRPDKAPGDLPLTPSSFFLSAEEEIERQRVRKGLLQGASLATEKQRKVNPCCFWKLATISPFSVRNVSFNPRPSVPFQVAQRRRTERK